MLMRTPMGRFGKADEGVGAASRQLDDGGVRITDAYNAVILNNDALIGSDGTAGRVNDAHVFKNYSPVRCGFVK